MKATLIIGVLMLILPVCWAGEPAKRQQPTQSPVSAALATDTVSLTKRMLTDEEMDQVSAGGIESQFSGNAFSFAGQSAGGKVDGSGTVEVKTAAEQNATSGVLLIQDSAQSGSKSFININAVNSQIQVLLNLNVNINSTVGTLRQINLSGK